MLGVSRRGYYAYKIRSKSRRRIDGEKLLIEMRRVFVERDSNYGSPRIWDQLKNKEHIRCSENRVAKLMRANDIVDARKRKFLLRANSKHGYPGWPNILDRCFEADEPNKVWVSDITYVWTHEGWMYVPAVLDLFSRGVAGLAMDKTIKDTLVTQAMRQAILRRGSHKGLICHTDRGSQYAENKFKAILAQNEFIGSMSQRGDCLG